MVVLPKKIAVLFSRQLHEEADLTVHLPDDFSCWPETMHEPLILAFPPQIRFNLWKLKGVRKLRAIDQKMQKAWKDERVERRKGGLMQSPAQISHGYGQAGLLVTVFGAHDVIPLMRIFFSVREILIEEE